MNARLIEKATTLKTTKGESQNAFKRINQAKVSAISARPADHTRGTNATLPRRPFVAAKGTRAPFRPHVLIGSIVCHVDDDGVLIEAGGRQLR
jgi:hypothetical protein